MCKSLQKQCVRQFRPFLIPPASGPTLPPRRPPPRYFPTVHLLHLATEGPRPLFTVQEGAVSDAHYGVALAERALPAPLITRARDLLERVRRQNSPQREDKKRTCALFTLSTYTLYSVNKYLIHSL